MSKRGPGATFGGGEERYGGPGPGNDIMDKPSKATDAQMARRKIAATKKSARPGASRGASPFAPAASAGANAPQSFTMAGGNGAGTNGNAFAFGGANPQAGFQFGGNQAAQSNPFSAFNQTQPAPASTTPFVGFGQTQPAPASTPSFTSFGQSQPATSSASNPFAQSHPATASQPVFTGLFGQAPAATTSSSNPFAQTQTAPASTPSFSGFGQSQPATTTSSNPFGQSQTATASQTSFFGQQKPEATNSSLFPGWTPPDTSRSNTPSAPTNQAQNEPVQQSLFGNLNQAKPESERSNSVFSGVGQQSQQNGASNPFANFSQPQAEPAKTNPFGNMTQSQSQPEQAKANNPFQSFGQTQSESSRASTPFAPKPTESEKSTSRFGGVQQQQPQQNGTSNLFNFGQKEAEPVKPSNPFASFEPAKTEAPKSNIFTGFGQAPSESSRVSTPFAANQPEPEKPKDLLSGFSQKPQQNGIMQTPKPNGEKTGLFGSTITAPTAQPSGGSIFDSIPKKAPSSFTFSSSDPKQVYRAEDDDEEEEATSSNKDSGAEAVSQTPKTAPRSLFDRLDKPSDSQNAPATPNAAPPMNLFGSINKPNGNDAISSTPKAAPPMSFFTSGSKPNGVEASETPKAAPPKNLFDRVDKDDGKKPASKLSQSSFPPDTPPAAPVTRALTAPAQQSPAQQSPTAYSHPPLSDLKKAAALKNLNEGLIAQLKNQDPSTDLSTILLFAARASAEILGIPPPSMDSASTQKLPAPPSSGNGGSNMFSSSAARSAPSTNGSSISAPAASSSQTAMPLSSSMFTANPSTPKASGQSLFPKPPSTAPPGEKRMLEVDEESSVQPATEKRAKPTSMAASAATPTISTSSTSSSKKRGFEQDDESSAQPSTENKNKVAYPELPITASKTARLFKSTLDSAETDKPSGGFSGFKPSTSASGFTPAAPTASGFKPSASTASPTKDTTSSQAKPTGGLTLPTFTAASAGGNSFLSSFGANAKKNEEAERQKRMDEEYDSEDDGPREEWLKRDREEQEKKRQKILDAAKAAKTFQVPNFGTSAPTEAETSAAPTPAEKSQGKGDNTWSTKTPIKFGNTTDTPSATPATMKPTGSLFGNLFPTTPAAPTPSGSLYGATPAVPTPAAATATEGSDKNEDESAEDPSAPQEDLAGLLPAELKDNSVLKELQNTKTSKWEESDQVGADGNKTRKWSSKASGRLFILKNNDNDKIRILCKAPQGQVLLNYNAIQGQKYVIAGKKELMVQGFFMDHIYETSAKPAKFIITTASVEDAKDLAKYLTEGAAQ